MSNGIEDAIAEAEAAAAAAPEVQAPAPSTALAAPSANVPVDMGVSSFLKSGGLQPDIWLDVKDTGLKLIKTEKAVIDDFVADLDFSQVKLFVGLRVKLPGNKFEYIKSYDGRTEAKTGKPWATAVQEANARAAEPAEQYRGADIMMVLSEPVKQGAQTVEAGKKIGYTTAVTGFGAFQSFLAEMIQSGDVVVGANESLSGSVRVRASHIEKSNASYTWGVVGFAKA